MPDHTRRKVALVTGGGGALGSAVVAAMENAGITICRENHSDPESKLEWFDVTDSTAVNAAVQSAIEMHDHVDIVVNLVGGWRPQPSLADTSDEELDYFLNLNLKSAFNVSRAAVPGMVENGWGRIINIGAMPGDKGAAFNGAYGISKAGVLVLTEAMGEELKGTGVTVNALVPSTIDTPANRQGMPDADFSTWVPPTHLASTILFLCTDEAGSITGERIHVLNRA
ncbi:MAG: SDR family oxidoreductase [Chloroflexi bacterium]|nr:SDR family oxidoreductase [Chloroflexota bacterium]